MDRSASEARVPAVNEEPARHMTDEPVARAAEPDRASPGEPEVVVLPDPDAVADEAAARVIRVLREVLAARRVAHVALTGGSTAGGLYTRLASPARRDDVDWSRVHLWWGDERYVPPDHRESNARLALDLLLGIAAHHGGAGTGASATDVQGGLLPGVPVPAEQVHRFRTTEAIAEARGPEWAAADYAAHLRELLPAGADGLPVFDLVLLGVGADGHILSVFPGSQALEPGAPLALAVPAPEHIEPHLPRLTLDPRIVTAADRVLVMATGSGKAETLADVLRGSRDVRRRPAQLARRAGATWLLDAAAAASLD